MSKLLALAMPTPHVALQLANIIRGKNIGFASLKNTIKTLTKT